MIAINTVRKDLKKIFGNMNTASKYIIRYGTVLIATLAVSAIFFFVKSMLSSSPYDDIMMYMNLLTAIKECAASIYIMPLIAEIIMLARKA